MYFNNLLEIPCSENNREFSELEQGEILRRDGAFQGHSVSSISSFHWYACGKIFG
jgi:hypothetical protein